MTVKRTGGTNGLVVAPSILAADFGYLADEIKAIDAGGADWVHVDIMDGRFVPSIAMGPLTVEAAKRATALPLNVHLMIVEPDRHIDAFVAAGADHVCVQAEPAATMHLHRVLSRIRELGRTAGVALNPGSPLAYIENVLHLVDVVIVMTVNPGFGGQAFLPETLPKIRALKAMCLDRGLDPWIEVDGGINANTARAAVEAGANALVAGSSVFGAPDYGRAIAEIRAAGLITA